jgi:hypothetical protein
MGKRALTVLLGLVVACATSPPPAKMAASDPAGRNVPVSPDAAPAPPPDAAPAAVAPSNDIHGTVALNVTTYCGGAAPRPGQQLSSRQLAVGHKLYLRSRKGGANLAEVTSDRSGAFAITLAPGEYCLISAGKADDRTQPSEWVDAACLANYRQQCDAVFTVPRAEPVAVELYQGCFGPCYHGPMPP